MLLDHSHRAVDKRKCELMESMDLYPVPLTAGGEYLLGTNTFIFTFILRGHHQHLHPYQHHHLVHHLPHYHH